MTHSLAWRRSTERLEMAREILRHPNMTAMLAILELDHPAKNIPKVHDGFGSTETLGVIKGFEQCLNLLKSLGEPAPLPPQQIIPTWGVPEESETKT